MAERAVHRHTVAVEAFQLNDLVVLDWTLYRAPLGDPIRRPAQHRRVLITVDSLMTPDQLTQLVGRHASYVLVGARGVRPVPRGLPWREIAPPKGSVPPGGGEGGANRAPLQRDRTGREYPQPLTERVI
jgi:hypothetical protein